MWWLGKRQFRFRLQWVGNRYQQTVNSATTTYTLDLANCLTQVLADGTFTYLYGLDRIVQNSATSMEYFPPDTLGSVRNLTTANGTLALTRSYEPFGSVQTSLGLHTCRGSLYHPLLFGSAKGRVISKVAARFGVGEDADSGVAAHGALVLAHAAAGA